MLSIGNKSIIIIHMALIVIGLHDAGMKSKVVEREAVSLNSVLKKVYRLHGYDFRNYKHGTVTRPLARRL